jgi:hypothetical protein
MWAQFDQLAIIDEVPVRRLEGLSTKLQVLVPMTERRTILSHYRDNRTSAHLGLRKTLAKVRQGYYWPQIFCVFPIWIKSTLSTWDATEGIGISMLSTWTMYNRHEVNVGSI